MASTTFQTRRPDSPGLRPPLAAAAPPPAKSEARSSCFDAQAREASRELREPKTAEGAPEQQRVLKLLIPHISCGVVMGKGGTYIKELMAASGAVIKVRRVHVVPRLVGAASESFPCLFRVFSEHGSKERLLELHGEERMERRVEA